MYIYGLIPLYFMILGQIPRPGPAFPPICVFSRNAHRFPLNTLRLLRCTISATARYRALTPRFCPICPISSHIAQSLEQVISHNSCKRAHNWSHLQQSHQNKLISGSIMPNPKQIKVGVSPFTHASNKPPSPQCAKPAHAHT